MRKQKSEVLIKNLKTAFYFSRKSTAYFYCHKIESDTGIKTPVRSGVDAVERVKDLWNTRHDRIDTMVLWARKIPSVLEFWCGERSSDGS